MYKYGSDEGRPSFSASFSIDFTDANQESDYDFMVGTTSTSSVPVTAAADGTVVTVGDDPNSPNGYQVVLNNSGNESEDEGLTTRYLHLMYPAGLELGDPVSQGDLIGYMGSTGTTTGINLHFGVRYDGSGASTSTAQYQTMEGLLLKSYQTECDDEYSFIRYYPSTNEDY